MKIRGHRIEPGEVEAALNEHPEVCQALVAGKECGQGDKRLVAYLVTRHDRALDREELRRHVARKLPDYMVPSAFVFLRAVPVAPGGKVNRQVLLPPDAAGLSAANGAVAPRDRLEFQLAQIWQSVLKVKLMGVKDNFFDLGGHSLTTVKLVAEIQKHLGIDLPVAAVFSAPTIERLAEAVRAEGWSPPRNRLIEFKAGGSKPPLFVIGASADLSRYIDADQPVYGLSFLGMFDKQVFPTTVGQIALSYVESVRSLQPKGPYYLAGHSSGGTIAFEMARLLESQGEKVGSLILLDTYGPRSVRVPLGNVLRAHWRAFQQRKPGSRWKYLKHVCKRALALVSLPARRTLWCLWQRSFFRGQAIAATPRNLAMAYDLAFRQYEPRTYSGRGILLRSREVKASFSASSDRGWTELFGAGLEIHDLAGDHWSILEEPNIRQVGECLTECLHRAQVETIQADR